MGSVECGQLNRSMLLDYFERAAKPRERWMVGMEVERMGRTLAGLPLPYSPPAHDPAAPSVRGAIEAYRELRGGTPVFEGPNIIGLNAEWGNISLEPGGQFEWSSRPYVDLGELIQAADKHHRALQQLAARLKLQWLDVAVEPDLALEQMPWMPKARYNIMRPFLGARGSLAHRMMTQSAAIQVAFDYADPTDWLKKFQTAAFLSPVATALFANSRRIDGTDSGHACYRHVIWQHTDPDRCGLPAAAFAKDFSLDHWLDWLLDVPSIFRHRAKGRVPTEGARFSDLMRLTGCDTVQMKDWESHVSTVFTDVRSYTYLEIRTADLQPAEWVSAVATLWTGLLYDEQSLDQAHELAQRWSSQSSWSEGMAAAARDGLEADCAGTRLAELAGRTVQLAIDGLRRGAACVPAPDGPASLLERFAAHRRLPL